MKGRFIFEYKPQSNASVLAALEDLHIVATPLWSAHWLKAFKKNKREKESAIESLLFGVSWIAYRPKDKESLWDVRPLRTDLYTSIESYFALAESNQIIVRPHTSDQLPLQVAYLLPNWKYTFNLHLQPY